MQSHDEMAFVEALHPGRRDAEIFDTVGLSLSPDHDPGPDPGPDPDSNP